MPGVCGKKIEHSLDDEKQSLHKRLLWNDIITNNEDMCGFDPDSVVDRSTPILTQKLKALQFCILVKNEKVTCDPFGDGIKLQRRLPLTSDAYAQRMFVLEKLRPEIDVINNEHQTEKEDCNEIKNDNEILNDGLKKDDDIKRQSKIESNQLSSIQISLESKSINADNYDIGETMNNNKIIDKDPSVNQAKGTSLSAENSNKTV